jgi:hypothetical protein
MTEIVMIVKAMMGILLKRPTVTITKQKRNLILLNHSNATGTDLNGWWPSRRFFNGNMEEIIFRPVEKNGKDFPSEKKLGDYVNEKGKMDVHNFLKSTRSISLPCGS